MLTNMEIAFKINQADINNQFETYEIALQSHKAPLSRSDFSNASNTAKGMVQNKQEIVVQFKGNCEFADKSDNRDIWLHKGIAGFYVQNNKYNVHCKTEIDHIGCKVPDLDPTIDSDTYEFVLTDTGLIDAANKMAEIVSKWTDGVIAHA